MQEDNAENGKAGSNLPKWLQTTMKSLISTFIINILLFSFCPHLSEVYE